MRIARNQKQMSTHMITLLRAIQATTGDICEMGAGFYSTPLLHWWGAQTRKLITYENDIEYLHYAKKFRSRRHKILPMTEVDYDRHWGLVFIDHTAEPSSRGADLLKFKNVDLFVIHDTEPEVASSYGYDQVWPHFKYRYDWKECKPHTTVVSNKIDVSKWSSPS